jgi:hypothetical protein
VSNINYLSINENFPVAGQDNDTQVFRDNFDTIKTSLRIAKEELTVLQGSGEIFQGSANREEDNDFNGNLIQNATLQSVSSRKKDYGSPITAPTQDISFNQAAYHVIRFGGSCSLSFTEFPSAAVDGEGVGKIGKVTLELYGDGTERTVTFLTSGSTVIKKSAGFPVNVKDDPLATPEIRFAGAFPTSLTVTSATNPTLIEVWQHDPDTIFLNYLGVFN